MITTLIVSRSVNSYTAIGSEAALCLKLSWEPICLRFGFEHRARRAPPFRDEVAAHRRDRHDDRMNHELYIIDGTDLGAEPLLE